MATPQTPAKGCAVGLRYRPSKALIRGSAMPSRTHEPAQMPAAKASAEAPALCYDFPSTTRQKEGELLDLILGPLPVELAGAYLRTFTPPDHFGAEEGHPCPGGYGV